MQKRFLVLFQFYKPMFFWQILFSGVAFRDIYINGIGQFGGSCFIKICGYISAVWFQYYFSDKTYYYYRNAGYPIRRLYMTVFCIDFLLYMLAVPVEVYLISYFDVKS